MSGRWPGSQCGRNGRAPAAGVRSSGCPPRFSGHVPFPADAWGGSPSLCLGSIRLSACAAAARLQSSHHGLSSGARVVLMNYLQPEASSAHRPSTVAPISPAYRRGQFSSSTRSGFRGDRLRATLIQGVAPGVTVEMQSNTAAHRRITIRDEVRSSTARSLIRTRPIHGRPPTCSVAANPAGPRKGCGPQSPGPPSTARTPGRRRRAAEWRNTSFGTTMVRCVTGRQAR